MLTDPHAAPQEAQDAHLAPYMECSPAALPESVNAYLLSYMEGSPAALQGA